LTDASHDLKHLILDRKVYLNGLPLPPSCNSIYATFKGRRIRSKGLCEFVKFVGQWGLINRSSAREAMEVCQFWIQKGYFLKVSAQISFLKSQIFTKDGKVKELDASNRMKALHDAISTNILHIDDRYFWSVSIEKVVGPRQEANLIIEPIRCQFLNGEVTQKAEQLLAGS
jgi:hypothetical protein